MATSEIPYNADVNNFVVSVVEAEATSDSTYGQIYKALSYKQPRYNMVAALCIPHDGDYYTTFKECSANGASRFYLKKASDGTTVKGKTIICTFISFYRKPPA